MRRMTVWRAGVLTALALVLPGEVLAQPSPIGGGPIGQSPPGSFPLPLYSTNPAPGGLFLTGGFNYYEQSNPLKSRVAAPGFVDTSTAFRGAGPFSDPHTNALDVNQVTGPESFQPGFSAGAGYRFGDGSALSVDFLSPQTAFSHAGSTLVPHEVRGGEGNR